VLDEEILPLHEKVALSPEPQDASRFLTSSSGRSLDYVLGQMDAKLANISFELLEFKRWTSSHESDDRVAFAKITEALTQFVARIEAGHAGRFVTAEGPLVREILDRLKGHDEYNVKQDKDNAVARGILEWKLKFWSIVSPVVVSLVSFGLYYMFIHK
jgi:hypothetical protein